MSVPHTSLRFKGFDIDEEKQDVEEISDPFGQFNRTTYETDRDRIMYSPYFRRLKEVTQVARADESYLYHDRMAHSLKVAQVGRRIAELLRKRREESGGSIPEHIINPDVVEAAALAHDMGHPPFGHKAESTLDQVLQKKTNPDYEELDDINEDDEENSDNPGGIRFEGNAQSFRIITRLAVHGSRKYATGLGLSRKTLDAVLKYPWGRGEWPDEDEYRGKYGYYSTESRAYEFVVENREFQQKWSPTAKIMDYADDVTYAVHDVTDFYKTGKIPLHILIKDAFEDSDVSDEVEYDTSPELTGFEKHLEAEYNLDLTAKKLIRDLVPINQYEEMLLPFEGSLDQRRLVDHLTSKLIKYFLDTGNEETDTDNNIRLVAENGGYDFRISDRLKESIKILKELRNYYVLQDSSLMAQQKGQADIIEGLFDQLYQEASKDDLNLSAIPMPFSEYLEENISQGDLSPCRSRARCVADFIASLTEQQTIELYSRLTGHSLGTVENQIVK